jgi:hypothetical protein
MVEPLGEAALRLRYFVLSADKAAGDFSRGRAKPGPMQGTTKEPILRVYEECLTALSEHERGEFNRIVTKMLGEL